MPALIGAVDNLTARNPEKFSVDGQLTEKLEQVHPVIEVEQSVVSTEPKVNVPSGNGVSIFRGGAGGLSYFSSASFRGALRVGAS